LWEKPSALAEGVVTKRNHFVEDVNQKGYQIIMKNGEPIAMVVAKKEFDKMPQPKTSLLNFFKAAPHQEIELEIQRSQDLPRGFDL
jgi:prevent-host-death family protein